jgi:hypothetical protein
MTIKCVADKTTGMPSGGVINPPDIGQVIANECQNPAKFSLHPKGVPDRGKKLYLCETHVELFRETGQFDISEIVAE